MLPLTFSLPATTTTKIFQLSLIISPSVPACSTRTCGPRCGLLALPQKPSSLPDPPRGREFLLFLIKAPPKVLFVLMTCSQMWRAISVVGIRWIRAIILLAQQWCQNPAPILWAVIIIIIIIIIIITSMPSSTTTITATPTLSTTSTHTPLLLPLLLPLRVPIIHITTSIWKPNIILSHHEVTLATWAIPKVFIQEMTMYFLATFLAVNGKGNACQTRSMSFAIVVVSYQRTFLFSLSIFWPHFLLSLSLSFYPVCFCFGRILFKEIEYNFWVLTENTWYDMKSPTFVESRDVVGRNLALEPSMTSRGMKNVSMDLRITPQSLIFAWPRAVIGTNPFQGRIIFAAM